MRIIIIQRTDLFGGRTKGACFLGHVADEEIRGAQRRAEED
jgi:hypothetical protein